MTEERKKYLDSISKEERAIRLELRIQKNRIRYLKEMMEYPIYMNDKRTMLRLMKDTRFIIKCLKKRLPAPIIEGFEKISWYNALVYVDVCPICKQTIFDYESNCCPCCGQRLR